MKQNIFRVINPTRVILTALCGALVLPIQATERLFTYTYEPETLPKGVFEFEQWVTARVGRNKTVGQDDFYRLQFREELEYGVTDTYQVALYFNHQYDHFEDPTTSKTTSHYTQTGFSLENKLLILNPAEKPVGLALYLEPTLDVADGAYELEEKIILGQRHGDWKWALNLTHETEWEEDFRETVGEVEATAGLTRLLGDHWAFGIEMRHHAEIEEYETWEGYAFYLGPVLSYRQNRWWATLTVMPQIYGANFEGDPDGESCLDLDGHERLNVRLLCGFSF